MLAYGQVHDACLCTRLEQHVPGQPGRDFLGLTVADSTASAWCTLALEGSVLTGSAMASCS